MYSLNQVQFTAELKCVLSACSSPLLGTGNFGDCYQYQGKTENCTDGDNVTQKYQLDLHGRVSLTRCIKEIYPAK